MEKQRLYVWGVGAVLFIVLMIVTPAIHQSQEYHNFADRREFFGIPNTLNVVSNFPFLVIGIMGLILCYSSEFTLQGELYGWCVFFLGIAAVSIGSSYYHLKPDDERLFWDRLPMTVAFTSVMAIFIIERIDEQKGNVSVLTLLITGVISILYWRFFDDLRPYAVVQFVPCLLIPAMAILLPPMYTHSVYWLLAAGFYILAKLEEAMDKDIYKWTNHFVSGHSLKHLCAAVVPVFLALMLVKRKVESNRTSLWKTWQISWTRTYISSMDSDYSAVSIVE